ncbi:MAG: phosphatidylserine/phosphatidylglycerophosphate/cardiolipin synthase family protein [Oceanicoccus sp.]
MLLDGDATGWESEQIVSNSQDYYERLLLDISRAVTSIDMAVYIFEIDNIGSRVKQSVEAAAARGVKIRLLIDGVGSAEAGESLATELSAVGADVRIYHPIPWYLGDYRWSLRPGGALEKLYHFVMVLNRRDHRKFCIIDNVIGWCGSFNICDVHLLPDYPWRDYAVRVTGEPIRALLANFDSVWFQREQPLLSRDLRYCSGNASKRQRRFNNKALVERIDHAEHRLWICNAYFSPSGSVISAIKRAQGRGVDVRLVVADRSDVMLFPMLSATYYADLLKAGIAIFYYQIGMLHAKIMLIDQQCVVGSTNLNHRSFYHDLELDVVLSLSHLIEEAEQLIEEDIKNSRISRLSDLSVVSRGFGFGWLLRIIRYWL